MKLFQLLVTVFLVSLSAAAVIKDVKYKELNLIGRAVDKVYPVKVQFDKRDENPCCMPGTEKRDILGVRCIPAQQCTVGK